MNFKLVKQDALRDEDDARIRDLLVAAFPRYAEGFSKVSYFFSLPEYRLWIEDDNGQMIAHLDFEHRVIGVGKSDVLISGVGEVATHPSVQGRGIGRLLMERFTTLIRTDYPADFGFLQCRPTVVEFYERVGWHRIGEQQKVIELDMNTREYVEDSGPAMILPGTKSLAEWPQALPVHLRGLPW